jgi:hypothetical protein
MKLVDLRDAAVALWASSLRGGAAGDDNATLAVAAAHGVLGRAADADQGHSLGGRPEHANAARNDGRHAKRGHGQ